MIKLKTLLEQAPIGNKWKKWNRDGYEVPPGNRPPEDNVILFDSNIAATGTNKSAVQMQLQSMLRAKGIYALDPKVGLIVWKSLDDNQLEARWLTLTAV